MSDPLSDGLIYFQARRYFEAHERWEDLWRATPPGPERFLYQGLIQGAAGLHHLAHGNREGARAQLTKALAKLESSRSVQCAIDTGQLIEELRNALSMLGD